MSDRYARTGGEAPVGPCEVTVYDGAGNIVRVIPGKTLRGRADPVPAQYAPSLGPREAEHSLVPQSPKAWRRATSSRKRTAA